jgi:hypothetical protein
MTIATDLAEAATAVEARKKRISNLLMRHPVSYVACGWTKILIGDDVFWFKKSKTTYEYITSGQLLENCGTGLISCGALTPTEYYG